jgi:hypothetical protein
MEILLLPLKYMGMVFIPFPFYALIPFAIFGAFYLKNRQRFVLITALLWALYFVYEYGMKLRILCSGECNIRVDLLLVYPLLVIFSMITLFKFIRWYKNT